MRLDAGSSIWSALMMTPWGPSTACKIRFRRMLLANLDGASSASR